MAAKAIPVRILTAVFVLSLVPIVVAQALWAPPIRTLAEDLPPATVISELISRIRLGDFRIVLDETPMADVARRFDAESDRRGDAGESLRWMCLVGEDTGRRWILWLEAGEIHGGNVGAF